MSNYHKYVESKYANKLKEILDTLPLFCESFFKERGQALLASSMVQYATDFKIFFDWVLDNIPQVVATETKDISLEDLLWINKTDIGDFLSYIRYNNVKDAEGNDMESAKATVERKSVSVSALFRYLHESNMISENPTATVRHRKVNQDKTIIYLDYEEQNALIRCVDKGVGIPKEQVRFWKKHRVRDLAILLVLLDTGMRVSELVGIDLRDIDFKKHRINVTRKGDKKDWVVLSDMAENALKDYMNEREREYKPHELDTALFLSSRHHRIGVRAVEILIKKYANIAIPEKYGDITPHKLRSTYATSLIEETGDIYLVAQNLGHSSLNTTRIYAKATDKYRTQNRNRVSESRHKEMEKLYDLDESEE